MEPAAPTVPPNRRSIDAIGVALGAAVLVSVAFRIYALGRLPGVNGDEAWYGVNAAGVLGGEGLWRTPNGNVPGPLHSGLLVLLQLVAAPSFALLRVPSVLASLGQMALTWWVVRRHLDPQTGAIALVLTAVLPVNVAYARFGWDPSHSGLVAIVAAHFALAGVAWASALAFLFALLVHPTNVFLAPFLLLAGLGAAARRSGWRRALHRAGIHAGLLAASLSVLAATTSSGGARGFVSGAASRALEPSTWGRFAVLYSRFLTGDTVYAYITGAGLGAAQVPADVIAAIAAVALLAVGARRFRDDPRSPQAGIVAGWLASVLAFVVLAGPGAIRPHLERYAMCLVVPTILAAAVLLREVGARLARPWLAPALTAALAAAFLAGFGLRYLAALEERGSTSHETFWTGPVEPKEDAFRRILAESAPRGGARVVADGFWMYWPLRYLALGKPLEVCDPNRIAGDAPAGGTYWVAFAGGPLDRWASLNPVLLPRWEVAAAGGRAAVRVFWQPR